jgi:microcystin-dependent protein
MAIQIKHAFVSAKGDGGDATLVRPSNWNAAHSTSMASGQLIGRLTAGIGAFEEIPISAYMATLLASADAATLAGVLGLFETGDVKYTFKTTAAAGWLLIPSMATQQTIGSAASTASLRANADTLALYTLIYNAVSDALAPVSGGRTGNATNDFNANKTITIPNPVGKSPMGAGTGGSGISTRVLGATFGEETHILTAAEIAQHQHPVFLKDPGHSHSGALNTGAAYNSPGGSTSVAGNSTTTTSSNSTNITIGSVAGIANDNVTAVNTAGGGAHNTVHPSIALNVMVKL